MPCRTAAYLRALADTDDDMGEVPADTVMRGADAGPEDCVVVWNPLQATVLLDGRNVEEWRIASTLCARQRTKPMRRALSTCGLRGTALESLKFRVSCVVVHGDLAGKCLRIATSLRVSAGFWSTAWRLRLRSVPR